MVAAENAPDPRIVQVSLMDTYALSISDINPDDVKLRFPYQHLTKIEGEPEYEQMCVVREEIYCNALSIKSIFGKEKNGHKGMMTKPMNIQDTHGRGLGRTSNRRRLPDIQSQRNRKCDEENNRRVHISQNQHQDVLSGQGATKKPTPRLPS